MAQGVSIEECQYLGDEYPRGLVMEQGSETEKSGPRETDKDKSRGDATPLTPHDVTRAQTRYLHGSWFKRRFKRFKESLEAFKVEEKVIASKAYEFVDVKSIGRIYNSRGPKMKARVRRYKDQMGSFLMDVDLLEGKSITLLRFMD
ncbi:unnamed protein product [Linum trigynum]|uniref:Uncharacterized protein n=1 Tax=Linum trigynum TaxID=586398 RepID=A0AAV2G8N7_9ROSI